MNRVADILGCIQQMLGKGLSFTKRCAQEIPGPQTKHSGKGMFIKPTFSAQLKCSRICILHAVSAPAFDSSEGIAERGLKEQLKFVAEHRVVDAGGQFQPLFQMSDSSVR